MQIAIAAISHRHGMDLMAAPSDSQLDEKLADYCKEYWCDWYPEEPYEGMDNATVIEKYFSEDMAGDSEFLERSYDEIELDIDDM